MRCAAKHNCRCHQSVCFYKTYNTLRVIFLHKIAIFWSSRTILHSDLRFIVKKPLPVELVVSAMVSVGFLSAIFFWDVSVTMRIKAFQTLTKQLF